MPNNVFGRSFTMILLIATGLVVASSIQQVTTFPDERIVLGLGVYSLLTAFALALSIPIGTGHFSLVHALGITAFLSFSAEAAPAMTLALFAGGSVGGAVLVWRLREAQDTLSLLSNLVLFVSSATLPYFIAGQYYLPLGLSLPVESISGAAALDQILPLTAYALIYVLAYFTICGVQFLPTSPEAAAAFQLTLRKARTPLISLLMLPVPFALLFARVARPDESLFSFVTASVGSALAIFGLYALSATQMHLQRQLAEVRSISEATRALRSDLGQEALLETLARQVRQLLAADDFIVALRADASADVTYPFVMHRGRPQPAPATISEFDEALIQRILRNGDPIFYYNRVAQRAGAYGVMRKDPSVTSWMGVPLILSDLPAGVFVVQSRTAHHFDEADLRVLSILASSASIALENARLFQHKSESAEQLATLNQVTTLLTGTLSANDVLDTVVSSASTISDAHAVSVYLYDTPDDPQSEPRLRLARSAGLSDLFEAAAQRPLLAQYAPNTSSRYLQPSSFVVGNIATSTEIDAPMRQRLHNEGKQAIAELPLMRGASAIGVLVLYFDTPQTFLDEQLDLLQAFCTQAAQAIDNARTFTTTDQALEKRVEQLYALAMMGRLLNAELDPRRIFEIVLDYAQEATHAQRGAVAFADENDTLSVPAHSGYAPDLFRDAAILQQGPPGDALRDGHPALCDDVRTETGYIPLDPKTRSRLIVPITQGERPTGLILLESDHVAQFSETDSQYVAQIANQAVIALDKTRLFHRIREARDNLKVILDTMEEGIILIDSNHQVALANPRVDLVDLVPDDILNQPIQALVAHPDLHFARRLGFGSAEALIQCLQDVRRHHALTGDGSHTYEVGRDGQSWHYIQRQIIPVYDDHQQVMGLLIVFYDKTEERELARAQEMISQMIVHDLRSPLTAVTTSLRLLDELIPESSPHRAIVDKTTKSSRRAIRKVLSRVDSLLDISKMESGELQLAHETVSISRLAQSVQAELAPLAEELEVTIVTEIAPDLPLVSVDSDKIERTLLNLVDNALKYSPLNGTVTIHAARHDGQQVRVAVTDEGPGIPDEYKSRLFDRFVQVSDRKSIRRGVGLGLTFCKLAVEAHGGKIWIEDNAGGGSKFLITLPLVDTPPRVD